MMNNRLRFFSMPETFVDHFFRSFTSYTMIISTLLTYSNRLIVPWQLLSPRILFNSSSTYHSYRSFLIKLRSSLVEVLLVNSRSRIGAALKYFRELISLRQHSLILFLAILILLSPLELPICI